MAERLTPLDTSFLEIEQADDCSHMHIGWAMIFDPLPQGGVPSVDRVRELLAERLDALPHFRMRLSEPRAGGLSWPSWQDREAFDRDAHVRHATLPSPGGDAELLEWLSDFYSHRLDRARPLWEMTLLDGLPEGGWALATKVHHCLVDGVSGASVTSLVLDASPQPEGAGVLTSAPQSQPSRERRPGLLRRGARTGVDAMLHPRVLRDALERSRALAEFIVKDELIAAEKTSLNVPIGASRRLAFVAVPLADLKEIKRRLGGSVNDVVLAVAAGGLRRLFEARGEPQPARGVRVMVPVSLRQGSEKLALGNRVSSLFVELPVALDDPIARYRTVVKATERLKSGGLATGAQAVLDAAGVMPPMLHAQLARLAFTPRLFNLTITNVPGPQSTLYAFGAPMRRVIPIVPIFALHAVGLAVASYDGEVVFGLNADHGAMPDLHVLAAGLDQTLRELKDISGVLGAFERPAGAASGQPPRHAATPSS